MRSTSSRLRISGSFCAWRIGGTVSDACGRRSVTS